mmetsp:Transcript_80604/g.195407  ORF Transcript_80604/g.195407 Transcript_80604/m.195407 type:complete len:220 (-) Transcript_80604:667-1326(-)
MSSDSGSSMPSCALRHSQRRFCASSVTSAKTARIESPAGTFMSGLRLSWPGMLDTSSVEDWRRALRYSVVAIHVEACATVESRTPLEPREPSSRFATSNMHASTWTSSPGRGTICGWLAGGPVRRVMSRKTLTRFSMSLRAAPLRALNACAEAALLLGTSPGGAVLELLSCSTSPPQRLDALSHGSRKLHGWGRSVRWRALSTTAVITNRFLASTSPMR